MLFKDERKAIANTTTSNKRQEFFGNWEPSDELDDTDLMSISGGVDADVSVSGSFGGLVNVNALNCAKLL